MEFHGADVNGVEGVAVLAVPSDAVAVVLALGVGEGCYFALLVGV